MMNEIGGDGVKKSDPSTGVNRRDFLQQAGMASVALAAGTGVSSQILAQGLPRPGVADWRRFGYDLHNTRFNARETVLGPDNVSRLKLKWTFQAEAQIQTTPTVIGDTLFFGAHDGYQYALESATGKLKWKFKTPGEANRLRSSCQYVEGRRPILYEARQTFEQINSEQIVQEKVVPYPMDALRRRYPLH